jgi:hypothetical protein
MAATVRLQPMDGIVLDRLPGTFADRDHDGMPDYWEREFFSGPTNGRAGDNEDGDGLNNLEEWLGGSNPFVVTSYFKVSDMRGATSAQKRVLFWPSTSNRSYTVEFASNWLGNFNGLTSGLPATPFLNAFTDAQPRATAAFYRVRVNR